MLLRFFKASILLPLLLSLACVNNNDESVLPAPRFVNYDPGAFILRSDHDAVMATATARFYAQGGNFDFTYYVEDANAGVIDAASGELIAGTTPGTYTVYVRDATGLVAQRDIVVYEQLRPDPMSSEIYSGESIDIEILGGVPPYTVEKIEGGGELSIVDGDTFNILAPFYETTTLTRITDSVGNFSAADIKVFAPFTVTPLEGKIPSNRNFQITVRGGKPPYTFTLVNGQGSFDPLTRIYTPDLTKEEKQGGSGLVEVLVEDSLSSSASVRFEVFVPHDVAVGDNHSCALNNITGKVKCWGKGFDGVLGNGDLQGGPMWGDEDSEWNAAGTAMLLREVKFWDPLTESFDRILDYQMYNHVICALIEDSGTGRRDYRCFGTSRRINSSGTFGMLNSLYGNHFRFEFSTRMRQFNGDLFTEHGGFFSKPEIFRTSIFDADPNFFSRWSFGAGPFHQPQRFSTFSHLFDAGFAIDKLRMTDTGTPRRIFISTDGRLKVRTEFGFCDMWNGGCGDLSNAATSVNFLDNKISQIRDAFWFASQGCVVGRHGDYGARDLAFCFGENEVRTTPFFEGLLGTGPGKYYSLTHTRVAEPLDFHGDSIIDDRDQVAKVTGSNETACALLSHGADAGDVHCWGYNRRGSLGIGQSHGMMVGADRPVGPLHFSGKKIRDLGGNGSAFCAITVDGELWCWGFNEGFALGLNKSTEIWAPERVGLAGAVVDFNFATSRCAITDIAGVKSLECWGTRSRSGYAFPDRGPTFESGDSIFREPQIFPLENMALIDPIAVRTSFTNGCLLAGDRAALHCWGMNHHGQLGYDNSSKGDHPNEMGSQLAEIDLGPGAFVTKIVSGSKHMCALLQSQEIKCWGRNNVGQLGQGDLRSPTHLLGNLGDNRNEMGVNLAVINAAGQTRFKDVFAGYGNSCAIDINDRLYCWGQNANGQLAQGNISSFLPPSEIVVSLDPDEYPVSMGIGASFMCSVLGHRTEPSLNGNVKCWGFGGRGNLGYPYEPVGHFSGFGIASSNNNIGDSAFDTSVANLPYVNLGARQVTQVTAGHSHTCFLLDNAKVKCVGRNDRGPIGIGRLDNDNDGVNDDVGDEFFEMGENYLVNLGVSPISRREHGAVKLASGAEFNCAVLEDDRLKCWGASYWGQLGLESQNDRGDANNEMGDQLPYVRLEPGLGVLKLSAGPLHSCVVLSNNQVKCWGTNFFGQLGYGDFYHRGYGPSQMSGSLPYVDLWP